MSKDEQNVKIGAYVVLVQCFASDTVEPLRNTTGGRYNDSVPF